MVFYCNSISASLHTNRNHAVVLLDPSSYGAIANSWAKWYEQIGRLALNMQASIVSPVMVVRIGSDGPGTIRLVSLTYMVSNLESWYHIKMSLLYLSL